jgi:hypothetical protein
VATAQQVEEDQQIAWFSGLKSILLQQFVNYPEVVHCEAEMIARAKEIVARHRFSFAAGAAHACRLAVVGPRESGKSTFLSIIAKQVLLDMLATGDWKQTLVFSLDLAQFVPFLTDLGGLFKSMVRLTFQSLVAQLPLLLPHVSGLISAFEMAVGGKPLLPKSIVLSQDFRGVIPALRHLLSLLTACWNDQDGLEPFLLNTFKLPMLVGDIFGYRNYFLIVDHLDLADTTLGAIPPFTEATVNVFVVEIIKFMLASSSFLVSCQESSLILNLFPAISDSTGIDLTDGLAFTSTLDVVPLSSESNHEIIVSFEGENPQISLSQRHFGGCAAYLQSWAEINRQADRVDEAAKNNGDVEECRLFLIAVIQKALQLLFIDGDGAPIALKVRSATRINARV